MLLTRSLSKAIRPMLILSRCVGILPRSRKPLLSVCLFLYSLFLVLFVGYGTFGSFLWLQYPDALLYDSLMHLAIEKAQKGVLFANYLVVLSSNAWFQRDYQKVLTGLKKIDKALRQLDMPVSYSLTSVVLLAFVKLACLSCLMVLDYFLSIDTLWLYTFTDLVSTHCPLIPIFSYELQFYAVLDFLAQHLNYISQQLANAVVASSHEDEMAKIYNLINIYDELRTLSQEVNRINSIPLLMTVASIFCLGIVNFHLLGTAGSYKQTELFSFLLGSAFLRLYELWYIIQPFVKISKEVDKFNSVLFKGMMQDRSGELYKNEILYIHISKKRGISFSACGFFPLDFTLIQSVSGAGSTLLVILIQYSLSKTVLWCD